MAQLIGGSSGPVRYSEHLNGKGPTILKQACDLKLEGIVSKRADSRYSSGRITAWTKVTCRKRDTFVVAGIAHKAGKFDGIYLARRESGGLVYAGKVERGFSEDADVEYPALTGDGKLRHPSFKGIREDL